MPNYPYAEIDLDGKSFPLHCVEIKDEKASLSKPVGSLIIKDGAYYKNIVKNDLFVDGGKRCSSEEVSEVHFGNAALSVGQFQAKGYSNIAFLSMIIATT